MKTVITINTIKYTIDLSKPLDISMSIRGSKDNANAWYIEEPKIGHVFYREDSKLEETSYDAFLNVQNPENRIFNPDYDSSALQIVNLTDQLLDVLAQ